MKTVVPRVDAPTPLAIAGWLGFVEPATPEEDMAPFPNQKSFHVFTSPSNR